jgi:STE24 endopeptidase
VANFDPAAATEAYLAALSPAGHLKAVHYTQGGHWLLLWGWLVSVAVAFVILRTGVLHRIRKNIDGTRRRPLSASLAVGLAFLGLSWLLGLPWSVYADWWRETSYGLNNQSFFGWFTETLTATLIFTVVMGLVLVGLYALLRRAPRTWWIWASGLAVALMIFGLIVAPIAIEPLFNKYTPAPPGPVRDAVVALAKKAHVPSDKIYIFNGSKQSNRYTANVSGLFGSARVAMSDTMFQKGADLAEVRGVLGHEMGHYARAHILWFAGISVFLCIALFGLIQALFAPVATLLRAEVVSIADPAGLPVIMIIVATLGLLATPLMNTITRLQEADADHFSLVVANEPDGLAKALVKTIEYRADSPSWIEEFIFYDHPSVRRRVQRAMDWKAAHMTAGDKQDAIRSNGH